DARHLARGHDPAYGVTLVRKQVRHPHDVVIGVVLVAAPGTARAGTMVGRIGVLDLFLVAVIPDPNHLGINDGLPTLDLGALHQRLVDGDIHPAEDVRHRVHGSVAV